MYSRPTEIRQRFPRPRKHDDYFLASHRVKQHCSQSKLNLHILAKNLSQISKTMQRHCLYVYRYFSTTKGVVSFVDKWY
jgi:hypothetical protein